MIPIRLHLRPLPAPNGNLQPFVVVHATTWPTISRGGAVRAAPEAKRCLATAVVGHFVFIPRTPLPAVEFHHLLTLQLPAVRAARL